ncbi:MAG: hypothetical protein HQ559_04520 [Lentisphaerae bacterium]|nr:hypothetical protein [Lentisphaerota bacterium]
MDRIPACAMKYVLCICVCCLAVPAVASAADGLRTNAPPGSWEKPGTAGWIIESETGGERAYGRLSWSSNFNGRAALVIRGGAATDRPVVDRIHGPAERWKGLDFMDRGVHTVSLKFHALGVPPGVLGLYFRGKTGGKTLEWLCEVSGLQPGWSSLRVPLTPIAGWWNEQGHMTMDDFKAAASSIEECGVWLVYQRMVPGQLYALDDFRIEASTPNMKEAGLPILVTE